MSIHDILTQYDVIPAAGRIPESVPGLETAQPQISDSEYRDRLARSLRESDRRSENIHSTANSTSGGETPRSKVDPGESESPNRERHSQTDPEPKERAQSTPTAERIAQKDNGSAGDDQESHKPEVLDDGKIGGDGKKGNVDDGSVELNAQSASPESEQQETDTADGVVGAPEFDGLLFEIQASEGTPPAQLHVLTHDSTSLEASLGEIEETEPPLGLQQIIQKLVIKSDSEQFDGSEPEESSFDPPAGLVEVLDELIAVEVEIETDSVTPEYEHTDQPGQEVPGEIVDAESDLQQQLIDIDSVELLSAPNSETQTATSTESESNESDGESKYALHLSSVSVGDEHVETENQGLQSDSSNEAPVSNQFLNAGANNELSGRPTPPASDGENRADHFTGQRSEPQNAEISGDDSGGEDDPIPASRVGEKSAGLARPATDLRSQSIAESAVSPTEVEGRQPTEFSGSSVTVGETNTLGSGASARSHSNQGMTPATEANGRTEFNPVELTDRIATAVRQSQNSGRQLRIRLNPPELGALQIEVSSRAGAVSARLEVQTQSAQRAILDNISLLQDALSQNGTSVDRIEVHLTQDGAEDWASGESEQQNQDHDHQHQNGEQGKPFDHEAEERNESESTTLQGADLDQLDIQV